MSTAEKRRVVVVTGLSGAGKASIMHVLEDLGYEAVDNPPLLLMEELVARAERSMAVGVDARSRGFDACAVLAVMARLRAHLGIAPELVFAAAAPDVLLRRFTETRRRHPLAPRAPVREGICAETRLLAPLREAADIVIDTSALTLAEMRRKVETGFGLAGATPGMTVSLMSFAYPAGLPPEADLVFDARFLRNPHYDPILRGRTGLDPEVAAFVAGDPDHKAFVAKMTDLLSLLLPRFVAEGKKYATVAIGCTGGRHRSVHLVEVLARHLASSPWRVTVTHRDIDRSDGLPAPPDADAAPRISGKPPGQDTGAPMPAQAQEA